MDQQDDLRPAALEEVTTAAFNGVLKALERRNLDIRKFPGPIIVGIIAWPEMTNLQGLQRADLNPNTSER
jgi:hypothetical protein